MRNCEPIKYQHISCSDRIHILAHVRYNTGIKCKNKLMEFYIYFTTKITSQNDCTFMHGKYVLKYINFVRGKSIINQVVSYKLYFQTIDNLTIIVFIA